MKLWHPALASVALRPRAQRRQPPEIGGQDQIQLPAVQPRKGVTQMDRRAAAAGSAKADQGCGEQVRPLATDEVSMARTPNPGGTP